MIVRLTFPRYRDEREEEITYLFIHGFLFNVDLLIYNTPDYLIEGRYKLTMTLYGLSVKEADTVYLLALADTGDGGLIETAEKLNSDLEEDIGNFEYTKPDYKEGAREELEQKKGFNLDIQKFVGGVIMSTIENLFMDNFDQHVPHPTTTAAIKTYETMEKWEKKILQKDPNYIDREIAAAPMEKDRKIRRPRKPRTRKSETRIK